MQGRVFLGVYSSGNESLKGSRRRLFFVWDNGQGTFDVQRVSADLKPVDILQTLPEKRFTKEYVHEPDIKVDAPEEISSSLASKSAINAMEVEDTLREHFRKALLRSKRPGEREASLKALQTLAEVEEGIVSEHKHMFTDFGIDLRKQKQLKLALAFCQRVLSLSPEDDHAHFNAARILLDMGDLDGAEQHLLTALDMDPDNEIYQRMLRHMKFQRLKGR